MDIPREPANLSDVAFVDEAFWHTTDDGRWVCWDRDDAEVDEWADLVAIARKQDQRDPVVYILESEAKALAETGTRYGRELGRIEALDEALSYVETEARWQVELMKRDRAEEWGHSVQRLNVVAGCIRNARSAAPGATSDGLSASGVGTGGTEGSEAPETACLDGER